MDAVWAPLLLAAAAYVLGSLPFAVWISRGWYGSDIRTHGSGNAGSTNMYRVFGFRAGLATQLLDVGKGALAAALPLWLSQPVLGSLPHPLAWQLAAGLLATLGHVYPVLAGFRGGKGVNTLLGCMLVAAPWGSLVAVGVFGVVLLLTRMVSAGSMLGTLGFATFYALLAVQQPGPAHTALAALGGVLVVFVVYTHRSNLRRIRSGTENRVRLGRRHAATNKIASS